MALNKKPVTGMKDILPAEMEIRDYVINLIKETYKSFGFTPIETPCMESIGNLTSKQGGENEKLIFKILKRGEKLNLDTAENADDLVDFGMRYDLTVPLVRYYANHANELPKPFKALQIGPVWRADRPQKGRFRQFYQCDIDTLGDNSALVEIELILATTTLLSKAGFDGFKVRINDRRILKGMAAYSGFPAEDYDKVFIILDKMDKIGIEGAAKELQESGYSDSSITSYLEMFKELVTAEDPISYIGNKLCSIMEEDVTAGLIEIRDSVQSAALGNFELAFDPALVRGMSYYTGTIFEIEIEGFSGSVAGGGRYDDMVGKFTNISAPACGFSIGFERIVTILLDKGFKVPGSLPKKAFLIEKGISSKHLCQILKDAQELREQGIQVLVSYMNKNKKFQKEQLSAEGYTQVEEYFNN